MDPYARKYLSWCEDVRLANNSVTTYDSHLTAYVVFLHDNELAVLSAEFTDVLDFLESCLRRRNRQSTIEGKLSTLREMYRYIHLRTDAQDKLQLDPLRLRDIDVSRYKTPEPIERDALARGEIRLLFDAFDSYRNRLMAVVVVETGLRNSDLRNLRIPDLDLDELEIHVADPKGAVPYDVPISADLAFELDLWLRQHRGAFKGAGLGEYVFPSQHGAKLESNGSFGRIIKRAAERAGIQETIERSRLPPEQQSEAGTGEEYREWSRVTPHTLRHSYITLLSESGVGLPYRQLVANHRSPETTQGYTHGREGAFETIRSRFDPPR
ncbi:tyrosine-type recombinase/integrase [Halobacterium rubrum]|uniref:tyrosine-type recombinase/integrase n=1 Tax=Halobacterium TaxID=2239 RepID=UPI003CC7EF87